MVQTFLIDLPVMLLFGMLFAVFSRREERGHSVFLYPAFWQGVVFSTLFNGAVLYAAIRYPDWMWMYFLEESPNRFWTLLYLFIFLYYLPYILGFYLGRLALNRGTAWWALLSFFLLVWEGWLIVTLFDRYSVVGTREEFFSGKGMSLFSPENPLGRVLNFSVSLMAIYYVAVVIRYRIHRRSIQNFESEL